MKRTVQKLVLLCGGCALALYGVAVYRSGHAAAATTTAAAAAPQATPTPTNPAMDDPDQFMWRAFIQVNQPAPGQQPPAPGTSVPVLWETWSSDEETFPGNGVAAAPCFPNNPDPTRRCPDQSNNARKRLRRGLQQQILLGLANRANLRGTRRGANRGFLSPEMLRAAVAAAHSNAPVAATAAPNRRSRLGAASATTPGGFEEVTRNLASFNYIVQNNLYTKSGLTQQFNNNFVVKFPTDAIETKARWLPWNDILKYSPNANLSHYHVTFSGGVMYGLVGLHIMTKDTPNWVWATWEHEDNPNRCDYMGCHDDFGVNPSDIAPNPQPSPYPGSPYPAGTLTPALAQLMQSIGSEWRHYRLKGAQVDFNDPTGQPLILGNSVTEFGFVQTSSCTTCHSLATYNPTLGALNFSSAVPPPPGDSSTAFYGVPGMTCDNQGNCRPGPPGGGFYQKPFDPVTNPKGSTRQFMPTDFVWAIPFLTN